MTTLEALKANLSHVHGIVISDNAFLKALIDNELDGTETYSKAEYEQTIDLTTVAIYRQVIGAAGISEGDLSYSPAQIDGIKRAVDGLLVKHGLQPEFGSIATVRGVSRW